MSEQSGLPLGSMGTVIEKLAESNYCIWALRMTDYLLHKSLWDLTTGMESVITLPATDDDKYEIVYEK